MVPFSNSEESRGATKAVARGPAARRGDPLCCAQRRRSWKQAMLEPSRRQWWRWRRRRSSPGGSRQPYQPPEKPSPGVIRIYHGGSNGDVMTEATPHIVKPRLRHSRKQRCEARIYQQRVTTGELQPHSQNKDPIVKAERSEKDGRAWSRHETAANQPREMAA
jgi:hypothetical protein